MMETCKKILYDDNDQPYVCGRIAVKNGYCECHVNDPNPNIRLIQPTGCSG